MLRRSVIAGFLLAITVAATALAPAGYHEAAPVPDVYRSFDDAHVALNVLPPGQGGYLNAAELALAQGAGVQPDHYTDQLGMYEDLVERTPELANFDGLFKDSSFGVPADKIARVYSPGPGTTVVRDTDFNVPHVYGSSRTATMFGAGYVSGEDRMFMMDVLRHLSRGRLSELLGASPANLASDRAQRAVADYTEEELQAMAERVRGLGGELGEIAFGDISAFAAGVNAFIRDAVLDPTKLPAEYAALQIVPKEWKITDSVAESTLIGGTFSVGGGGQLRNASFINGLLGEGYNFADARQIMNDLRFTNDSEAPVSTDDEFPFNTNLGTPNPAAVAKPDPVAGPAPLLQAHTAATPGVIDGPFGPFSLFPKHAASNALLVNKAHSEDGHPMAVFGPQVGYYSPEILMEIDLHTVPGVTPGVHARGAAFPGISLYALLGRGKGYGWSATTAIGDHTDIRAVKLCEPDPEKAPTTSSKHYLRDGECKKMYERTDTFVAKPGAGGIPASPQDVVVSFTTQRVQLGDPAGRQSGLGDLPIGPDWALVASRGTVDGQPVAFVRQRSSYGIEVDATLTFAAIHDPARVQNMDDLMHAFGDWFSFSFNWHLIDGDDVAFFTTGRYPTLKPGVDPDLPFWGDSEWDWTGFLSFEEHPHVKNPAKGYITNWNNKQAPKFRAADDWWSYGPVGRMQLLQDGVEAALVGDGKMSLIELTKVMGNAATQDLRGKYSYPHVLGAIGTEDLSPAQANAVALLAGWIAGGAHRRDLDGDGTYDESAAVALADALWEPLLKAQFGRVLGDAFGLMPPIHDDAPGPGGSAYLEGWYGQVNKDLRMLAGAILPDPFSRIYCGEGSATVCRADLRGALNEAIASVTSTYGAQANWGAQSLKCASADPPVNAKSCADNVANKDAIRFSAVGVQGQRQMHWQNRPTFQQVLEFN